MVGGKLLAKVILEVDMEFAPFFRLKVEPKVWVRAEGNIPLDAQYRLAIEADVNVSHIMGRLNHAADLIHLHAGDIWMADQQLNGVG